MDEQMRKWRPFLTSEPDYSAPESMNKFVGDYAERRELQVMRWINCEFTENERQILAAAGIGDQIGG